MDKEKLAKISAIALNKIFGNEPRFSHSLIDHLGSCEAVFALQRDQLAGIFGPCSRYSGEINDSSLAEAEKEYDRLNSLGYGFISIFDSCYPPLLRECPDAPVMLYIRSSTSPAEIFNNRHMVSIVGTRDMSLYGKEWCTRIVSSISEAPARPVIVSGLAMGIDITAHLAALGHGLPTIAVSPVGIEDVYPWRHAVAAEKIASCPGSAIVTDYPPGTSPLAFNFLRRNRIIAGLGSSTILIESKVKGGGMMTARLASGYGRGVFVLPGRIDDVRSGGCNVLLAEKVAEPIVSTASLAEALGLGAVKGDGMPDLESVISARFLEKAGAEETEKMKKIVMVIKSSRGIDMDGICRTTGSEWSEVSRQIGQLAEEGLIEVDLMNRCTINFKNA